MTGVLVWIKVWGSISSPYLIARWYFNYFHESKVLPHYVTIHKETETGVLETMHVFLEGQQGNTDTDDEACDTIIYEPSTYNQASIRRFYISFKQTLKQKTWINLFFC